MSDHCIDTFLNKYELWLIWNRDRRIVRVHEKPIDERAEYEGNAEMRIPKPEKVFSHHQI